MVHEIQQAFIDIGLNLAEHAIIKAFYPHEGYVKSADRGIGCCLRQLLEVLWFAAVLQVLPGFLSCMLYRFEINVRSATILGIIGADGIGTPLIFAQSSRDWGRVGVILLGIIVMVTWIDLMLA